MLQVQHKAPRPRVYALGSWLIDTHTLHCETLGLLLMKLLFSMLLSLTGPTSAAAVQWSSHGYPEWSRAFTQHGTIFMCYSPEFTSLESHCVSAFGVYVVVLLLKQFSCCSTSPLSKLWSHVMHPLAGAITRLSFLWVSSLVSVQSGLGANPVG